MNLEEIKGILPHRDNMLLIEKGEITDENKGIGEYTVRGDEFFLQGHFPGNPVVPGVILCEIMAQTCCVLLKEQAMGKTPYFTGMDKVRFKEKVYPGDTIKTECEIIKTKGNFYFATGRSFVNGKLAVKGDFSFALM